MADEDRADEQEGGQSRDQASRLPVFDYDRCKACGICAHFCPKGALESGPGDYPRLSAPEVCNACRQCERLCPDFAVYLKEGGGQGQPSEAPPEACDAFAVCEE